MKLTNRQLSKIKDIPFRYDLHAKLWDWLSRHPDKDKADYFELHPDEELLSGPHRCFACEYADSVTPVLSKKQEMCRFCPLKTDEHKSCLGGLFLKWAAANEDKQYKLAAKYAKQIRDLPLNPMYNFKDAI